MCDLWNDPEVKAELELAGWPEPPFSMCECGEKVHVGDWPVCKGTGNFGGHKPQGEYRPFIPFWDPHIAPIKKGQDPRGVYISSLAQWNGLMHRNGVDMGSKYDREVPPWAPSTKGMDKHFNEAVRQHHGGMIVKDDNGRRTSIGNLLRDED